MTPSRRARAGTLMHSMKPKASTPMQALHEDERGEDRVHLDAADVAVGPADQLARLDPVVEAERQPGQVLVDQRAQVGLEVVGGASRGTGARSSPVTPASSPTTMMAHDVRGAAASCGAPASASMAPLSMFGTRVWKIRLANDSPMAVMKRRPVRQDHRQDAPPPRPGSRSRRDPRARPGVVRARSRPGGWPRSAPPRSETRGEQSEPPGQSVTGGASHVRATRRVAYVV